MKKIITTILVALTFMVIFANGDVSVSYLYLPTLDPLNGILSNFGILYFNIKLSDYLSFRASHALSVNSNISEDFKLDDVINADIKVVYDNLYLSLFKRVGSTKINLNVGKTRLKKLSTEQMEFLRVGGLKESYSGVGGWVRYGAFEIGGYYELFGEESKPFAVYGYYYTPNLRSGVYYSNRYNEVSADMLYKGGFFGTSFDVWLGVGVKTDALSSPTALAGLKVSHNFGKFSLKGAAQYVWHGSGYVDYGYGDPNEDASKWSSDFEIGVEFNDYLPGLYLGVLGKYNSYWYTTKDPVLLSLKAKLNDLEVYYLLSGEDLHTGISGNQKFLIKWVYYVNLISPQRSQPITTTTTTAKPVVQAEEAKSLTTFLVKQSKPTYKVKIKGVVTAPVNLLGRNQFYIADPTGGLLIYVPSGLKEILKPGDIVEVVGKFKEYYGVPEIVAEKVIKTGKTGKVVFKKLTGKPSYVDLGNPVEIKGKIVRKGKYDFSVKIGDIIIKVYIKKNTGISIKNYNVGDTVVVKGILYIYKGEYEILTRFPEDIEATAE